MSVVEFSADAWQASSPGLQQGLAGRVESVGQLVQGLEALAGSGSISGAGADAMRAYIREVHVPVLQSLLIGLSTFQTAVGVYWDGYGQVDAGGDFRLVADELDAHVAQLESGMATLRGFGTELRQIAADASHLVALGGAGSQAVEQTVEGLQGMHLVVKGQKETWQAYEASDPGFAQVQNLIAELGSVVNNVGGLMVGRGRTYQSGSFRLTLQQLGELSGGMLDYCRDNQKVATAGWERMFSQYADDVEAAQREKAAWDLLGDGLQIAIGALVTAIGVGLTPFTGGFSLGLTVLGGSLMIGGINSAMNHVSIATTGQGLNLIGMAAEAVDHWYDLHVAQPAADSGSWGLKFLAGAGSGAIQAASEAAQMNVREIADGIHTLATDADARNRLWNQVTATAGQVLSGDAYATGQVASVLIPGAAALKLSRTSSTLNRASRLPGVPAPIKITTPHNTTSALDWIKTHTGAGTPTIAKDSTPTVKPLKDKSHFDVVGIDDDLSMEMRKQLIATEKGSRPDPTTYLSPEYVQQHHSQFDAGGTRFMTPANLDKYGLGQRDGTAFVMPRKQVDALVQETGGDPRAIERALGLPDGFFDSGAFRIDIQISDSERLRIPSGNEAGANDQWIPGGKLPGGFSEGVIDVDELNSGKYSVSNMSLLEDVR